MISYWAWWSAQVTQRLSGSPDVERPGRRTRRRPGRAARGAHRDAALRGRQRRRLRAAGPARDVAAGRRPSGADPGTRRPSRSPRRCCSRGWSTGTCSRSRAWPAPSGRGRATARCSTGAADRAGDRHQALPAVPARRDPGDLRAPTGAAASSARSTPRPRVTWLLLNVPAYLAGPEDWKGFWQLQLRPGRRPRLGVAAARPARSTGRPPPTPSTSSSWLFFGAWCVGVLVLGLTAPTTPRLAQLGFLVVAGFLLVNKVYSPQYVLWLLPLAVLARPRWRDQLIWQATEVFYFACGVVVPRRLPGSRRRRGRRSSTGSRSCSGSPASSTSSPSWSATSGGPPRPGRGRSARSQRRRRWSRSDDHVPSLETVTGSRQALRPRSSGGLGETTRSKVWRERTRTSTSSPTAGTCAPRRQEQHRRLHVRRLGEQPLLAVDGERRPHEADGVEAAAGEGRGAGPDRGAARGRLEADAVGGAAADHDDVAGLRGAAAAVAEDVAALDRVHVEHGGSRAQRARGRRARGRCRRAAGCRSRRGWCAAARARRR